MLVHTLNWGAHFSGHCFTIQENGLWNGTLWLGIVSRLKVFQFDVLVYFEYILIPIKIVYSVAKNHAKTKQPSILVKKDYFLFHLVLRLWGS